MAERVGDGIPKGWLEFPHVGCASGRDETLFAPEFAAHGGEGVGEGRALFALPGAGGCGPTRLERELLAEQGHEGEQAEQARRRAGDGLV